MEFDDSFDLFSDEKDPFDAALDELKDLAKDSFLQKNLKQQIECCIRILEDKTEPISIRINRVSDVLDNICDDGNIESFSRTRLYNVAQLLEQV